jgi:putative transposase
VYCALRLNLPRRTKRRLPMRLRQPLVAPAGLNEIWALDFMADSLYGWRPFRTLNVIDEGNRQVLGIEVATSIPARRVIRVMEQLIEMYGKPDAIRLDNGSELTSTAFTEWCEAQRIELRFIQPGKPDQNAYIERFNRTYRNEVLDAYVDSIEQVREVTAHWLPEYNEERPHDSLGRVPPLTFMPRQQRPVGSSYQLCP